MDKFLEVHNDGTIDDVEVWYAAQVIFNCYQDTGDVDDDGLMAFFGEDYFNRERTDLVLSFFMIMKYIS